MDEGTICENGSLGLDVAARCGLLVENATGNGLCWMIHMDAWRVYFVGDAKTLDLFEKCTHNLENNPTIPTDEDFFLN